MFRYLILYLLLVTSILVSAQQIKYDSVQINSKSGFTDSINTKLSVPKILFKITSYEADTVHLGSILSHEFEFTNSGNQPLLISNVRTSCNCAVASFPKAPVLPGKTGKIRIDMDTSIPGSFTKVIAVYSNAKDKPRNILHIKWYVSSSSCKTK